MKACLSINVYQNQHCYDKKKACFGRILYFEDSVPNIYGSLVDAFRVLFGAHCVVCFDVSVLDEM